ncbi:hypothetical protein UPYG_G00207950 [Umbra pygmaea]|uniref:Urotensin-related peptide 1 n=1 Tax=Umbra pygmaea TaxID=75934 RepID=A0ABD0WK88_UMBPY
MDGQGGYKSESPSQVKVVQSRAICAVVTMQSITLFYILAGIFSARRTHGLPLYPDTSLEPQEEFIQKLMAEVVDGEQAELIDQRAVKNIYPVLLQHDDARETWNKAGAKSSMQQDTFVNMVDDLKAVVLKLAAADKLHSQGFLRSDQNLPKTNKRACFWKYCVTN